MGPAIIENNRSLLSPPCIREELVGKACIKWLPRFVMNKKEPLERIKNCSDQRLCITKKPKLIFLKF